MAGDALDLTVALGIGLLLGVERERHKGRGPQRGAAGVRTFALVGLLGGLASQVGGVAPVTAALAFVGAAAVASYLRSGDDDPGLTTEVALVVTYLLGVLAGRETALAAGTAVAVALTLAERERLHLLVRETLSERELHDALLFCACALIVLPLMPDEGLGPNDALNPATVWRLVVIVMAVQGAGYVALRLVGPRYGLLVAGVLGGLVSSTATIATMGARSREQPQLRRSATAAGVASTVATIVLLAIVVAAVDETVLRELLLPLALAGAAAMAYALLFAVRSVRRPPPADTDPGRAFDLRIALGLAALVTVVLLAAGALNAALGRGGVLLGSGIAGFADSQSAAASAATLAAGGHASTADAVLAVLVALTTNTVSKAVVAAGAGGRRYALSIWPGLAAVIAAAWAGWALTSVVG